MQEQKEVQTYMGRIIEIEGIGPHYRQVLKDKAGLTTTEALLAACATPQKREALALQTGVSSKLLLEWANRADLFRIKGIGEEYSDLLEQAGVDTVVELSKRNAENLLQALKEANDKKALVRRLPTAAQVQDWVAQAKKLPRALTY
jgi:predicted flap endonuclease-1-like 5' DNA nuclease